MDDILVTYYHNNKRNIKVITYMQVVNAKYVKILDGISRRVNYKVIRDLCDNFAFIVYHVTPQDYIERSSDYTDVEFFKLTDEEAHLLLVEFI